MVRTSDSMNWATLRAPAAIRAALTTAAEVAA